MRVYRDRYYIEYAIPGISGFQRWKEREYRVMLGSRIYNRAYIVKEFLFNGGKFSLEDGHLPEYQPVTGLVSELYAWLDSGGHAFMLTPEAYGLETVVN